MARLLAVDVSLFTQLRRPTLDYLIDCFTDRKLDVDISPVATGLGGTFETEYVDINIWPLRFLPTIVNTLADLPLTTQHV